MRKELKGSARLQHWPNEEGTEESRRSTCFGAGCSRQVCSVGLTRKALKGVVASDEAMISSSSPCWPNEEGTEGGIRTRAPRRRSVGVTRKALKVRKDITGRVNIVSRSVGLMRKELKN